MALTTIKDIVYRNMGGQIVDFEFSANAAVGDAVAISGNGTVAPCGATDVIIGVAMEDVTFATEATGAVFVGPGIVYCKSATGQTAGTPLTAGASGALAVATEGTHHVSGLIYNGTYTDTDYPLVAIGVV